MPTRTPQIAILAAALLLALWCLSGNLLFFLALAVPGYVAAWAVERRRSEDIRRYSRERVEMRRQLDELLRRQADAKRLS